MTDAEIVGLLLLIWIVIGGAILVSDWLRDNLFW